MEGWRRRYGRERGEKSYRGIEERGWRKKGKLVKQRQREEGRRNNGGEE